MRSFSFLPSRLILVHPPLPPFPRPFTFPSHIILVNPSSHMPFYLFISFNISSHLCVFSPLVLDPRGKCRVFRRKRFTFPRGRQGHRLHRPLSRHLPFPPPGKVPGFSAKTVHFPPQLVGVSALQVPLAALAISPLGESAGNFGENGSLSPVADRDTGSTGLSGGTCHFHPWGKCRVFRRKRFTFPHGRQGYRLHRPLWPHLQSRPPGKVPGISAKTVHFPPWPTGALAPQASLAALGISTPGESAGFFLRKRFTFPRGMRLQGRSSRAYLGKCLVYRHLGKCLVYRHSEKEHLLDLG